MHAFTFKTHMDTAQNASLAGLMLSGQRGYMQNYYKVFTAMVTMMKQWQQQSNDSRSDEGNVTTKVEQRQRLGTAAAQPSHWPKNANKQQRQRQSIGSCNQKCSYSAQQRWQVNECVGGGGEGGQLA